VIFIICSVMEDFCKDPGDKDFIKIKVQYVMFVDPTKRRHVCGCYGLETSMSPAGTKRQ
jgi:hypothetical protein